MKYYWTRVFTPVHGSVPPDLKNIAPGELVEELASSDGYSTIKYHTRSDPPKSYTGVVDSMFLEEYEMAEGVVDFSGLQTPTPQDAPQYIKIYEKMFGSRTIHNICGVACLCRIYSLSMREMLDIMKVKEMAIYNTIASDKPLGLASMERLVVAAGGASQRLYESLHYQKRFLLSPGRVQDILLDQDGAGIHGIICGVKIDNRGFVTDTASTGHWVVLEYVDPFGINNGVVCYYNPFHDAFERTSWNEFIGSMKRWGSFSGLIPK